MGESEGGRFRHGKAKRQAMPAMKRLRNRPIFLVAIVTGVLLTTAALLSWSRRPPDPERWFREARAELDAGHPDRAEKAIRELERLRPPTPFDRLLRAQVDEAQDRPEAGLANLAAIDDAHPLAPVARLLAGQIEVRRHRLRAAEAQFLRTVTLEPKAIQAHRELTYLYNIQQRQADLDRELHALSELDSLSFERLVHWGKTRNTVWKPDRDCDELAKFVAADPDDRRSRLALAEGLRRLSRWDEAVAALASLPDSDPDARARRALIALDRDDREEFDRLVTGGAMDNALMAQLRGKLALKDGRFAEAVTDLRLAYQTDPTDRSVLQSLGAALRGTGDDSAAEPFFAAARRFDAITPLISRASTRAGETDPALPAQLGAACEAAGRLFEARAWYKLALANDPLNGGVQKAVFRLGRAADGRADSERSAVDDPTGRAGMTR